MKCDLCGKEYKTSCMRCARRVAVWGIDGTIALIEMSKSTEGIESIDLVPFIEKYYIGKAKTRTNKVRILRKSLEVLGYSGLYIGRIYKNKTDYLSMSYREHNRGIRWQLKKDVCEKCGATEALHLHHIVPVSWGGVSSDENCVTLCDNCHKETHKILSLSLNRTTLLKYLAPYKNEIYELSRNSVSKWCNNSDN